MATHSSILAWRITGTEEPGGLPSKGLHRVGHDWSDLAAAAAAYNLYSNNLQIILNIQNERTTSKYVSWEVFEFHLSVTIWNNSMC